MNDTLDTRPIALAITGEFTIFTAAALKQTLLDAIAHAEEKAIDIDLSAVSEIDSAGLQLMVMAKREAATFGKELNFVRISPAVTDLIDLCDLSPYFAQSLLDRPTH